MAGEIQIGGTTFATESGGTVIIANVDSATNRTNLGLGSIATQASDSIDINGGAIDGATIGGTSAAAGTFTTFTSTGIDDNASSTALTIDSSGNCGIGTTSPDSSLEVNKTSGLIVRSDSTQATATNKAIRVRNNSDTDIFTVSYLGGVNSASVVADTVGVGSAISAVPLGLYGTATWCAVFRDSGGTDRHYFYASGASANSTGVMGTISDERLKENITDAAPKLSDIMRLRVVNYNLIGDPNKQLGFLAQEFEQVFPSLVFETDTRQYDEDGNLTKGLADQKIIKAGLDFAILTKAIQEQQALIESQQSQIDALTVRIEALETA